MHAFGLIRHAEGAGNITGENGTVLGVFSTQDIDLLLKHSPFLQMRHHQIIALALISFGGGPSFSLVFSFDLLVLT